MKKRSKKELWKHSSAERLQVWISGSFQKYLTQPTSFDKMDISSLVKSGNIETPKTKITPLADNDILGAAFTKHAKGYYASRTCKKYRILAYVLKGRYRVENNDERAELKAGMCFISSPQASITSIAKYCDISTLWFHIGDTPAWRKIFGEKFICRTSKRMREILSLSELYAEELYSTKPSSVYLKNISALIAENIRRDFFAAPSTFDCLMETYLAKAEKTLSQRWTLQNFSDLIKVGVPKINAYMQRTHAKTFSKFMRELKMQKAQKLIKAGLSMDECAKHTGFADRCSFSKCYKSYYGESPSGKDSL